MKKVKCGVYKITNIVNDKIYIGSSKDMFTRWRKHLETLRRGKHHSIHLQRSYDKHGEDNFKFEIIEECSEDERCIKEQFYLDSLLKAQEFIKDRLSYFSNHGYNMNPNSSHDGIPRHVTRDQLIRSRDTSGREPIYQVECGTNVIIGKFDFFKEVIKATGKTSATIKNSISKCKALKGCNYYFCWESKYDTNTKHSEYRGGCLAKGGKNPQSKKIYVYSKISRKLYKVFNSCRDCAEHFKISIPKMSSRIYNRKSQYIAGIRMDNTRDYMFFLKPTIINENCWEKAVFKVDPITMNIIGTARSAAHFNKSLNLTVNKIQCSLDKGDIICGHLFYRTETYYKTISKDIV